MIKNSKEQMKSAFKVHWIYDLYLLMTFILWISIISQLLFIVINTSESYPNQLQFSSLGFVIFSFITLAAHLIKTITYNKLVSIEKRQVVSVSLFKGATYSFWMFLCIIFIFTSAIFSLDGFNYGSLSFLIFSIIYILWELIFIFHNNTIIKKSPLLVDREYYRRSFRYFKSSFHNKVSKAKAPKYIYSQEVGKHNADTYFVCDGALWRRVNGVLIKTNLSYEKLEDIQITNCKVKIKS